MRSMLTALLGAAGLRALDVAFPPGVIALAVGVPLLVILIFLAISVVAVVLIVKAVKKKKARAAGTQEPREQGHAD